MFFQSVVLMKLSRINDYSLRHPLSCKILSSNFFMFCQTVDSMMSRAVLFTFVDCKTSQYKINTV